MRFEDDKPLECEHCGEMIYAGDYALIWNNKCYCSEDCVKDAMYEKYGNEVKLRRLFTAEEYEAEYGDMKYDEMRGK